MLLIVIVGPALISQDLRFNAIPLYFSRPLRRIDYFLGKLAVIGGILGLVMLGPSVIAYFLGLLFSLDITILRDTLAILLGVIVYSVVVMLSAGTLVLALSSLSRNSRYVALMWLGVWIISSIVGITLQSAATAQRRHEYYRKLAAADDQMASPSNHSFDQIHHWQEQIKAREEARTGFRREELDSDKTDWRPLISYTSDLTRIEQKLLGTQAAWQSLSELEPDDQRDQFLLTFSGQRQPWYWSASVLIGLFAISAGILNLSVKSLDRAR